MMRVTVSFRVSFFAKNPLSASKKMVRPIAKPSTAPEAAAIFTQLSTSFIGALRPRRIMGAFAIFASFFQSFRVGMGSSFQIAG